MNLNTMGTRNDTPLKADKHISVRRMFVLLISLCIFQQLHVLRKYSIQFLDSNERSLTTKFAEPSLRSLPNVKPDEEKKTKETATESENVQKIVNRFIIENEKNSDDNPLDNSIGGDEGNIMKSENLDKVVNKFIVRNENNSNGNPVINANNSLDGGTNGDTGNIIESENVTKVVNKFIVSATNKNNSIDNPVSNAEKSLTNSTGEETGNIAESEYVQKRTLSTTKRSSEFLRYYESKSEYNSTDNPDSRTSITFDNSIGEDIGDTKESKHGLKVVNGLIVRKDNVQREPVMNEYDDDIERAMFVISMGKKAAKTKSIERLVYSARKIGKYSGWIVVLTDASPGRYDGLKNWTDNVIVMEPRTEDVMTHYKYPNMAYKRFKTMAIDYIDRDPRLNQVELVYYLDADIVFGDKVNKAFHGLETTYGIGRLGANSTNSTSLGRGEMWMFKGNLAKFQIQGGQMILDRVKSQPCLERWRKGFDDQTTGDMKKDQYLLMAIKEEMEVARNATLNLPRSSNITALECEIILMEQKPYIEFPLVKEIRNRSKRLIRKPNTHYDYSPIVHVRNDGGTANMKDGYIRPYMANLLRFKKDQKDVLEVLKKVRMETT